MITGGTNYGHFNQSISDSDISIIRHLINDCLKEKQIEMKQNEQKGDDDDNNATETKSKTFDDYVYSTFYTFVDHKKVITLNVWQLYFTNNKMRDFIMYSMEESNKKRDVEDMTNLFHPQLVKIFKNAQTIIISYSQFDGKSYSFSLSSLLSLLVQSRSLEKVMIKGVYSDHWMHSLWSSSSQIIKQEYDEQNYEISYLKDSESVVISKKN